MKWSSDSSAAAEETLTSAHAAALLLPHPVFTLLHFKKSQLQPRWHVVFFITLDVRCFLPLFIRLHQGYISAPVRPPNVFTWIISFISCPSIHALICPFTPPSVHLDEPPSTHLGAQTTTSLHSHFTLGFLYFSWLIFSSPLSCRSATGT